MNRRIPLSIFALALAGSVFAQNRGNDFQITKISRDLITTPQFNYSGAEQKRETHERWLRVDVQFSAAPDFTQELTLKYYILMNGKVLTGEVTHVNVLAGRELYSCVYVPPHALAHVLGNRPPNTTSVENVAVQVLAKRRSERRVEYGPGPAAMVHFPASLARLGSEQERDAIRAPVLGLLRADQTGRPLIAIHVSFPPHPLS